MSAPFQATDGQAALQELYAHLDGVNGGDTRLAWYGQLRAEGLSHAEAMEGTLVRYAVRTQPWYLHRFPEATP